MRILAAMDPEDRYPRLDLCRGKSPWDVLSLTATPYAHAQQNLKTGDFHKQMHIYIDRSPVFAPAAPI